jgi:hypothetical protein
MQAILLKLSKKLLEATDRCARALGISLAEYIRRAVERMNRESEARTHAERMSQVSRRVRAESMRVNGEFATIERAPMLELVKLFWCVGMCGAPGICATQMSLTLTLSRQRERELEKTENWITYRKLIFGARRRSRKILARCLRPSRSLRGVARTSSV